MDRPSKKTADLRLRAQQIVSAHPELVDLLDQTYPLKPLNPDDSDRQIWIKAGQRQVVDWLLNLREKANAESLTAPRSP